MRRSKAHVKIILFVFLLLLFNCGQKNEKKNGSNIQRQKINYANSVDSLVKIEDDEICILNDERIIKKYIETLESTYNNQPERLKDELVSEAKKLEDEVIEIFDSIYNSDFELDISFGIDKENCVVNLNYNIHGIIEEDGETYKIESSTILQLVIINNEIKISSISFAG